MLFNPSIQKLFTLCPVHYPFVGFSLIFPRIGRIVPLTAGKERTAMIYTLIKLAIRAALFLFAAPIWAVCEVVVLTQHIKEH